MELLHEIKQLKRELRGNVTKSIPDPNSEEMLRMEAARRREASRQAALKEMILEKATDMAMKKLEEIKPVLMQEAITIATEKLAEYHKLKDLVAEKFSGTTDNNLGFTHVHLPDGSIFVAYAKNDFTQPVTYDNFVGFTHWGIVSKYTPLIWYDEKTSLWVPVSMIGYDVIHQKVRISRCDFHESKGWTWISTDVIETDKLDQLRFRIPGMRARIENLSR